MTGRRGAQDRFYVGRRAEQAEVYVVTRRDVERLPGLEVRSSAESAWGSAAGLRGRELAVAVLRHTTGLPDAGFVIGCDDVALWLAAHERDPQTWRRAAGPFLRRRLTSVLAGLGTAFTGSSSAAGDRA
jgi:hypothetical protein